MTRRSPHSFPPAERVAAEADGAGAKRDHGGDVGIDIGTSAVKAVAADGDGTVVARARVSHGFGVPNADRFEHDADAAWRAGPLAAFAEVTRSSGLDVKGVSVSAMVPSLTAVDREGSALLPGLLYGDERGRTGMAGDRDLAAVELEGFVRWATANAPGAFGLWPAQAMANHALGGEAVLDTTTAATAHPLFDWSGWDAQIADRLGARVEQLPRLVPTGWEAGRVGRDGPPLAAGCVDAFAEQLVAGADHEGDVLVLLGTTLVVWVVVAGETSVPGYLTVPHTAAAVAGRADRATRAGSSATGWRSWSPPIRRPAIRQLASRRPIRTGSRCGRRTRGLSGRRSTIRSGEHSSPVSTSPTTRRRSDTPRTRRRASWCAERSRPRASTRARMRSEWWCQVGGLGSRSGYRRSPTRCAYRSTAWRSPTVPRSARHGWRGSPPGSRIGCT